MSDEIEMLPDLAKPGVVVRNAPKHRVAWLAKKKPAALFTLPYNKAAIVVKC